MDDGAASRYWKERASSLEAELERLRARLLALAVALPPDLLHLLEADPATIEAHAWLGSPVSGVRDTLEFTAAEISIEMERIWSQLRRSEPRDD
jgi:hypothetical protein